MEISFIICILSLCSSCLLRGTACWISIGTALICRTGYTCYRAGRIRIARTRASRNMACQGNFIKRIIFRQHGLSIFPLQTVDLLVFHFLVAPSHKYYPPPALCSYKCMAPKVLDHRGLCSLCRCNIDREHRRCIKLFHEGCYISLSSVFYNIFFSLDY
jgi:hypothetical protein